MATTDLLHFVLRFVTALGCGLMAGFFFAFSNVVMAALGRLSPHNGIAAMQSVNVTVQNPLFFLAFFGTPMAGGLIVVLSLLGWDRPGALLALLGSLCHILGVFVVTVAFNVPLNEALARIDPSSSAGAEQWNSYLSAWTGWNHVRTVAALLGSALLTLALHARAAP